PLPPRALGDRDRGRRRRPRHSPRRAGARVRALLHRPAAPGLWPEFRPRPVDLQADHRGAWRSHLGREPPRSEGCRRRADGIRRPLVRAAARAMSGNTTVHASAVKVGDRAVLIRGPSGSGKSRLAFDLILAGRTGQLPPALLVGDDRVNLDTDGEKLWVRPARELAGLIEIRGLGIRRCESRAEATVTPVVYLP